MVNQQNSEINTTAFLQWLAEEEDDASTDSRKRQLSLLGGRIMSIRCGFKPSSDSEVDSARERMEEEARCNPSTGLSARESASTSLVKEWSPEQEVLRLEQADQLQAFMQQRRQEATTAVAGRVDLRDAASAMSFQRRAARADAPRRILEVLVAIASREERQSCLPAAFTPPSPHDSLASMSDPQEELLHTSPMQLLQSIRLFTANLKSGRASSYRQIDDPQQEQIPRDELLQRLRELESDVMQYWQDNLPPLG